MKANMGDADRLVRLAAAVVLIIVYFVRAVPGIWGTVMLLAAAVLILTSMVRVCPLYLPFGISTRHRSMKQHARK